MSEAADHEIRPLRREDAPAWRALRLEMLKDSPAAFASSHEDALARTAKDWAASIPEDGEDAILGLYAGGRLRGSAGVFVRKGSKLRHRGMMWGVYVQPALRGRGLGEALVKQVIAYARQHVAILETSAITANARSLALYHKLGFEPYGVERDALRVDGVSYDEELLAIHFEPRP